MLHLGLAFVPSDPSLEKTGHSQFRKLPRVRAEALLGRGVVLQLQGRPRLLESPCFVRRLKEDEWGVARRRKVTPRVWAKERFWTGRGTHNRACLGGIV